jgi:dihydroorotate dehydrogenase
MVEKLKRDKARTIIGGNIGKNTLTAHDYVIDDYCTCFKELFDYVDYFVINVSCPNIAGLSKLQDKEELICLLQAIQEINFSHPVQKPVLLKIAPDLTERQLDEIIEVVTSTKLNGIIATNTSTERMQLVTKKEIIEAIGNGGLSGKPLRDQSTKAISYLHKKSKGQIPIIAVGGVFSGEDALEKLQAGATLVQVYTGFIYEGPSIAKKINRAILRSI